MIKILRCRFCDHCFPPTKNGQPAWGKLASHIADRHPQGQAQIAAHVETRAENSAGDLGFRRWTGAGGASVGKAFRKALGYSGAQMGADQGTDDDN